MNNFSRQLIKIAKDIDWQSVVEKNDWQSVVEKQEHIFRKKGCDFKKTQNGYIATITKQFLTYTFTLDRSDARQINTLYPKISYSPNQQNLKEVNNPHNAFEAVIEYCTIETYATVLNNAIQHTDEIEKYINSIKDQLKWLYDICKELANTY